MAPRKGTTNNPKGRPPSERALTVLLERALSAGMQVAGEDHKTARKRVMAQLLAQAVSEGKVTFPDGRKEEFSAGEWVGLVLRVLRHVDGQRVEGNVNVSGVDIVWDWTAEEERVADGE